MNDYSKLAGAFMQRRPQNGGIVPPHMQQQRPMNQPMGGMQQPRPPMQPRPMNPQQSPAFGQFGGNIPRPMGGGIMGGQPQAPRPMQQPMGRRPF